MKTSLFVIAAGHPQVRSIFALDTLHAAAARGWSILGSDTVYEKLGLRRVIRLSLLRVCGLGGDQVRRDHPN